MDEKKNGGEVQKPQARRSAFDELNSISFNHVIGEPLRAAIEAQQQQASAYREFIQNNGLKPGTPEPQTKDGAIGTVPVYIPRPAIVPVPVYMMSETECNLNIQATEKKTEK